MRDWRPHKRAGKERRKHLKPAKQTQRKETSIGAQTVKDQEAKVILNTLKKGGQDNHQRGKKKKLHSHYGGGGRRREKNYGKKKRNFKKRLRNYHL